MNNNTTEYNIFSCSDNNYARHLGVLMTSIRENNKDIKINYWIISNNISEVNKNKLSQISSELFSVKFADFDVNLDFLEPTIKKFSTINLSTYMRLFVTNLIPENIERILYLDCDMVCRGSLKDLLDSPFENNIILGVRDPNASPAGFRLNVSKYINAGLLMIDLTKWKENNVQDRVLEYLHKYTGDRIKLKRHDQDAINAVLSDKIGYIDKKWNTLVCESILDKKQLDNTNPEYAIILHLILKPWVKGENNPYAFEYEKYLKISPWAEEPMINQKKKGSKKWKFYRFMESNAEKLKTKPLLWHFSAYVYKFGIKQGLAYRIVDLFDTYRLHTIPPQKVIDGLKSYADAKNPSARILLAKAYRHGWGLMPDQLRSFEILDECIISGDYSALDELKTLLPDLCKI